MGKHTINNEQTTSWQIDESGKTWTLTKDAKLSVNMTTGVTESGLQHDNKIVINGDVTVTDPLKMNNYRAFELQGVGTELLIGKGSKITSDYGISFASTGGEMTNNGIIDTVNQGVAISMDKVKLTNNGSIDGAMAVQSFGDDARIINSTAGEIKGSTFAITAAGDGDTTIDNDGLINGGDTAILGGDGKTHVINTGKIVGDVDLKGGNDIFDNRGGDFKFTVKGGAGNDTYYIDKAGIDIEEDVLLAGTDMVKSTVSYSLATSGNDGIENLKALGPGNIKLTGNDLGNHLTGNDGNNRIAGGMGDDTLIGGKGSDTFVFKTGDALDTIKDFQNGTDRIDISDWAGMDNIQDIKQHLTVDGDNLVITMGTDELVLLNTSKAELNASDFLFA